MRQDASSWVGQDVVTSDGVALGRVVDVYVDDDTNAPEWLELDVAKEGRRVYVPISHASATEGGVNLPFSADDVANAPAVGGEGVLSRDDEVALYQHYGVEAPALVNTDDGALVVSEEQLHVTTRPVESGRVRLRKWVDTQPVSAKVAVQREEVHVEREPIAAEEAERLTAASELGEAEIEVVLHEEEIEATTVTVPKERVRLEKTAVTEERQVDAELQVERVEVEDSSDT
jgi:uncharacterized protein (TIGR02271 family)